MPPDPAWLPEEYRDDPTVKDITDLPTLVKNYKEAQSFIGQSIRIPGENASKEDQATFLDKLRTKVPTLVPTTDEKAVAKAFGIPDKPEEYSPPADVKLSDDELKAFRERSTNLGLSKKQAENALKAELKAKQESESSVVQNMQAIEKEWGAASKTRLEKIAAVAEKFGFDKDWVASITTGKVPLNALAPFHKMVEAIGGEGNQLGANAGSKTAPVTPQEADRQLAELMKNPAFLNSRDPTFKHLQQEFMRLNALSAGLDKLPDPYTRR